MTKALELVKELNEQQSEVKVTLTHVLGHAYGWGLYKIRRDMGRVAFGVFSHSKKIGLTILCDVDGGKDLVPVTIFDIHKLSVIEYAKKCTEKIGKAKGGKDTSHKKSTQSANFLPAMFIQPIMFICTFINIKLGWSIPGVRKGGQDGHYILTNVGTLGMNHAYAPLSFCVFGLACTGKVRKSPVYVDGKLVIQDILTLTNCADHRYGDAALFVPMRSCFKGYFEDPKNFDPAKYKENAHYTEQKN